MITRSSPKSGTSESNDAHTQSDNETTHGKINRHLSTFKCSHRFNSNVRLLLSLSLSLLLSSLSFHLCLVSTLSYIRSIPGRWLYLKYWNGYLFVPRLISFPFDFIYFRFSSCEIRYLQHVGE